jgi:GTP-binding protein HflX
MGGGGVGAGETKLELDRRHVRDRIKELKTELAAVADEHVVRKSRREKENSIALVGYTNAGKSSLMRALTGSEVLVADKLFATLDTTVRPLHPPTIPKILVSDTVGFIKKLPHDLVASFRSTLDEAAGASLLLFVVDASDSTFRSQLEVTKQVLGEIDADQPSWLILNKRDRLKDSEIKTLAREFPDAIFLSTKDKKDIEGLKSRLLDYFEDGMKEFDLLVPFTTEKAIGALRTQFRVLSESHSEKGTTFRVRAKPETLESFRSKFHL